MTPEKRLEGLIAEGGVIAMPGTGLPELTLAGALWLEDDRGRYLRWCAIFPQHQGHIHETRYEEARVETGGRDVCLYAGGRMVAGVVPYIESNINTDDVREALARWRAHLSDMDFADFLRDA